MRLLFVAPFPYGPHSSHGGAVAAFAQFDALRGHHDIAVVAFEPPGVEAAASDYLAAHSRFVGVPLRIGRVRAKLARLRAWLRGWPIDAEIHRSQRMADTLRAVAAEFRPDAVVIQFPQMAQYVEALRDHPVFMDVQDAFSVSAFRIAGAQRGWRRRERLWDWLAWVHYERRFYSRFDAVFTLTEQDLLGLRAYSPALVGQALGVPLPLPEKKPGAPEPGAIRFVGGFAHPANRTAVAFFLREIWPRIRDCAPQARVEIAGRHPPAELLELAGERVRFLGFVPDLTHFLATAAVVVVPLRSGGGIKIKMLEALAAGAAVVSTSIGAEGVGGSDGRHFLVRDDPEGFAAAVLQILAAPARFAAMRGNGRALVAARYAPSAWRARFEALIGAAAPQPVRQLRGRMS